MSLTLTILSLWTHDDTTSQKISLSPKAEDDGLTLAELAMVADLTHARGIRQADTAAFTGPVRRHVTDLHFTLRVTVPVLIQVPRVALDRPGTWNVTFIDKDKD